MLALMSLLILGHPAGLSSYTGGSKTESHEEVEGGTGLAPGDVHAATAVVQHALTQVCTLLHLLLKQQVAELGETQGTIRHCVALSYAFWTGCLSKYAHICLDKQKAQRS